MHLSICAVVTVKLKAELLRAVCGAGSLGSNICRNMIC